MKKYIIYFEIFGKKLRVKIIAKSVLDAQEQIRNKIKFHKIKEQTEFDDLLDIINKR